MLFSQKRTILFINREKIQWAEGNVPKGEIFGKIKFLPWSEKNLGLALEDIEKKFPATIRLVVGEDFSYVTHFQKKEKEDSILREAQTLIPEKMEEGWDSLEEKNQVQVMAVQEEIYLILKKAFLGRSLQLEAMEAESLAIARMIPIKKDQPVIFAKNEGKIILGIIKNKMVLATRIFSELPEIEKVKEFISYTAKQKNISIKGAYIQDKSGSLVEIFKGLGLDVAEGRIDPMVGVCLKKDISGKDGDVLNINFNKNKKEKNPKVNSEKNMSLREKILFIIFLLVIIISSGAVYYVRKIKPINSKTKTIQTIPSIQTNLNSQDGLEWGK